MDRVLSLIENDILRFVLEHILIITVVFIICIILWAINSAIVYSFASAVEYPNAILAWIPIGTFNMGVLTASMAIASGSTTSVGFIVFLSILSIISLMSWIPIAGLIFAGVCLVSFIIIFIFMIKDMYGFCQAFNKSFILSLICWFFIPIVGRFIIINGFKRAYIRETEGL